MVGGNERTHSSGACTALREAVGGIYPTLLPEQHPSLFVGTKSKTIISYITRPIIFEIHYCNPEHSF